MGVCIGAMLRIRDKEQKALAAEFAITAIVAGTSEPCLYGICTRYKRPFIGLIAGGFAGGLYAGIMGVISANLVPSTNFLSALAFTGGTGAKSDQRSHRVRNRCYRCGCCNLFLRI